MSPAREGVVAGVSHRLGTFPLHFSPRVVPLMQRLLSLALVTAFAAPLSAQTELMPSIQPGLPGWFQDRFAPDAFTYQLSAFGRPSVIQIDISSNDARSQRPAGQQGAFYDTQGMKYDTPFVGSFSVSADLYLPTSWGSSDNGLRSVGLWATADDAASAPAFYPILGFTNTGGTGLFRYWNGAGYVNTAAAPIYDQWNSFRFIFDDATKQVSYFVNGALLGSVATPNVAGAGDVILNSFNFNEVPGWDQQLAGDYSVYWSNAESPEVVPEPATMTLLATGLAGMAAARRRRKAIES